jgi:hypothetical protein
MEEVTVGSESFAKAWTYDLGTGFRTAERLTYSRHFVSARLSSRA